MHAELATLHLGALLAVGRGLGIYLLFRALAHTVGWAVTLGVIAAVAVATMLWRRRQQ